MIGDSVAFCPRRGQAGRSTTPSTSSTPGATTAATRSSACAPRSTPAPRTSRSATPTAPACPHRSPRRPRAVVAELGDRVAGRHPHPQRRRVRRRQLARRGRGRARGWSRGRSTATASACGNANLISILPALQLKLGYECVPADRLRAADRDRAPRRRALQHRRPDPDQPYVGRNAFAHKGGMHVAGVQADARTFEHMDPRLVGNSREVLISELSGKGSVLSRAERAGHRARRRRRQARASSGSRSASTAATTTRRPTPPSSCCCAARRARTSRCSGSRASA